jgi:hypothetical protein
MISGENGSTHRRTTSFHCYIYNAAYYINLSSFNLSLCIKFTYACQAFMHLWVQQSAEAFQILTIRYFNSFGVFWDILHFVLTSIPILLQKSPGSFNVAIYMNAKQQKSTICDILLAR